MPRKDNGFIFLHRNIMDWGWYTDANTARVFIHCILNANYIEKEWKGIKIPVGSFVTSYAKLAQELNLTTREIRTAIKHLKMSHEIAHKGTRSYSIITVNNYLKYQNNDKQQVTQMTHKCHTDDTQMTTTNKRNKEIKKEFFSKKSIFEELKEKYERDGHL